MCAPRGRGCTPFRHLRMSEVEHKQTEMAQQTSIHIQPVQGGSEAHNKREKTLDYVMSERTCDNEYWQSDTQSNRLQSIKARYLANVGQQMQAKATPIREGVVVISEQTTMGDLHRLADRIRERWGIGTFQIAIHRDEGYKGAEGDKLNLHAHMVFDWTDRNTGKSIKMNKQDMAELQTLCADVLSMERGVSSDKKHLSAMQYKAEAMSKTVAKLETQQAVLQADNDRLSASNVAKETAVEAVKGLFGKSAKDKQIEALQETNSNLEGRIETLQANERKLSNSLRSERTQLAQARTETNNALDIVKTTTNVLAKTQDEVKVLQTQVEEEKKRLRIFNLTISRELYNLRNSLDDKGRETMRQSSPTLYAEAGNFADYIEKVAKQQAVQAQKKKPKTTH